MNGLPWMSRLARVLVLVPFGSRFTPSVVSMNTTPLATLLQELNVMLPVHVPATALPLPSTEPENPGPKYVPFLWARIFSWSSVELLYVKLLKAEFPWFWAMPPAPPTTDAPPLAVVRPAV